jgi:hypothetical protein
MLPSANVVVPVFVVSSFGDHYNCSGKLSGNLSGSHPDNLRAPSKDESYRGNIQRVHERAVISEGNRIASGAETPLIGYLPGEGRPNWVLGSVCDLETLALR